MEIKLEYITPFIDQIKLDHEISLVLQSDDSLPPIFDEGIGQMCNPDLFIANPINPSGTV